MNYAQSIPYFELNRSSRDAGGGSKSRACTAPPTLYSLRPERATGAFPFLSVAAESNRGLCFEAGRFSQVRLGAEPVNERPHNSEATVDRLSGC